MKKYLFVAALLALSGTADAWNVSPTNVSFVNAQGITVTGKLFRAKDTSQARPAIVMMHGCSGVWSYSDASSGTVASLYREWGDRLVAAGYVALLVDSFTPRGADQNQCGNGSGGTSEVNDRPWDAYAARDYLANRADIIATRIGLLGWSHGGSSTLAAMETHMPPAGGAPFQAAIALYPGCGLYGAFGGSASSYLPFAPVRILHGGADPLYLSGNCTTRVDNAVALGASQATGNAMDMVVYPGAQHSFDMAKAGDAKWTQSDLDAKQQADSSAMSYFDSLLKQ